MIKFLFYIAAVAGTVYMGIIYNRASLIFLAGAELLPLLLLLILTVQRAFLHLSFSRQQFRMEDGQSARDFGLFIKNGPFPVRNVKLLLRAKNLTTKEEQERIVSRPVPGGTSVLSLWKEFSCGIWEISCEKIRLSDFLLFFRIRKWTKPKCVLVCLPKKHPIQGVFFAEDSGGEEAANPWAAGGDASVVRDIREYRPGDRLSNVHWKLSAKKETLQVLEYGCVTGGELMFGIDCDGLNKLCLEVVYSILLGCLSGQCQVLLVWRSPEGETRQLAVKEEEQATYALELLMREGAAPFPEGERPRGTVPEVWLSEGRKLVLEGKLVQEFSEEGFVQQLSGLELFF